MKKTFYFLRQPAFPQIVYVGYVILIIAAIRLISSDYQSAIILLLLSSVFLLTRRWLRLDFRRNTLTRFFVVLPYKTIRLRSVEKVIITKKLVHQTLNSRGSSTTLRLHEYEVLLRADDENHLLQNGLDREMLVKKAELIAYTANVLIDDRTI